MTRRVGLIADTHGLLRPEAMAFLKAADHIVHAGDVGDPKILDALRSVAPVSAVRGNNDTDPWAAALADTAWLEVEGVCIYIVHDLAGHAIDAIDGIDGTTPHVRVLVSGHSHKPALALRSGVLFVNPGSAGPRRFKLPIAAGELLIDCASLTARILDLTSARVLASSHINW